MDMWDTEGTNQLCWPWQPKEYLGPWKRSEVGLPEGPGFPGSWKLYIRQRCTLGAALRALNICAKYRGGDHREFRRNKSFSEVQRFIGGQEGDEGMFWSLQ